MTMKYAVLRYKSTNVVCYCHPFEDLRIWDAAKSSKLKI